MRHGHAAHQERQRDVYGGQPFADCRFQELHELFLERHRRLSVIPAGLKRQVNYSTAQWIAQRCRSRFIWLFVLIRSWLVPLFRVIGILATSNSSE